MEPPPAVVTRFTRTALRGRRSLSTACRLPPIARRLALPKRRRRIDQLPVGNRAREDRHQLAALNLDGRHWFVGVGAGGIEANHAIEGGDVQFGQRIADLLRIDGAGLRDGVLEGQTSRGGLRRLIRWLMSERLLVDPRVVGWSTEDVDALIPLLRRPL